MDLLLTVLRRVVETLVPLLVLPLTVLVVLFNYIAAWLWKNAKTISGEVAVVTGGGNGLGKNICIQLASRGCHVAVVDIDLINAEITAQLLQSNYNIKSKAYQVDVANHDEVMKLAENITKDLGDVTILVNNAGLITFSSYPPHWHEVQKLINVNLTAHFWTLEAFLPRMKELKRGHIVNISSMSAYTPLVNFSQYTATKFGVRGLMAALRQELRQGKYVNIHATTIAPFFLDSNPRIKEIYENSKTGRYLAIISSDDAAISVVKAILYKEKETFLPSYLGLLVRIHACLPISLQDLAIYFTTKQFTVDLMK